MMPKNDKPLSDGQQSKGNRPVRATIARPGCRPNETREQAARRLADAMFQKLTGKDPGEYRRRQAQDAEIDDSDPAGIHSNE